MKKLLLSFALLFCTTIFAQKDTTHTLSTIEIEGVRAGSQSATTQTTLTKEDIQKGYFGQDAPVLFQSTPSITLESDGGAQNNGYMYYRLRGIDQTRINVTLNGISLVEPEDQGGYFSNYTDFLSNVNSIQIQRGVGTNSNGTSSFAGSVNLESANLLDSAYTKVQTGIGSYNGSRFNVGMNTGLMKNGFAWYGNFTTEQNNGFRDHSGYNGTSFFLSGGYYGKTNTLKLVAFTGTEQSGMAYLASADSSIKKDYANNPLTAGEVDHFTQSFVQLQDTKVLSANSIWISSLYYIGLTGNYNVLGVIDPTTMSNLQLFSDLYGATTNYSYNKGNFNMNLGLNSYFYYREHAMDSAIYQPKTQQYSNRGQKEEISAFARLSYKINKFTLYSDLQERDVRFSYYQLQGAGDSLKQNYVTWAFFNPKAGLTYNFTNKFNAYFSVGQEHREPTRTDMFQGSDNINYSIKELPSVSESVIDYELGTNAKLGKLTLQADIFYMQFTNEFTPIGLLSPWTGLPLMVQIPNSYRQGIEFNGSYVISKHFRYFANATVMNGELQETGGVNVSPILTPNVIINHGIECFCRRFAVGLSGRYVAESYLDLTIQNSSATIPETPLVNLLVNNVWVKYRIAKNWNIALNVNNIPNSQYFTNGYLLANGENAYFVGALRNYFVSLNATF